MKNYPLGFSAILILFVLLMMPIMAQEPTATPETPTNTVTPSATATSTATVTLTSTATATNTATATPLPAYSDIDACWVRHVNGTAATEWEIDNPNPVPIVENPNTKLIYDWWAYDSANAQGTVVNSVLAWDGNGPNPISTNYAQSLRVVWYMVTEGQPSSGILGELIINAGNTNTQCPSAATPTATATAMSGSGNLRIQLRENGADNNQQTSFVYLLINDGSTAPSNITVRMYFTLDSNFSASDYVLDQSYDSSNGVTITGPFLHDNDIYYFEMDYGSLALNPSSNWEWSGFMHHQNWLTGLSSANDWWITGGLQQTFTDTDYMPVYINDVLVLGQEPPLNATPTPSLTPTITLTPSETPDVTNTPTATPDPASGDVIVELKANGADNVQQAGFAYRISNTGTTDYDLITVRIYMQVDNQQAYSSYVAEGYYDSTNNVTLSGPHTVDTDLFYFELDYGSLIFGNSSVWEWNGITRLTDWSANFDSNNDWWKTGGLPADYEQTVYIPVYSNGVLIAGSEPNTGAPTETPTATATSTETLTPTATVTETETPTATATSNAIPTVTLTSANANYVEGSAPIAVVSAVDIQDDGLELCGATVQILNAVDADEVLAVNNTNPAMTVSYDLPTHTLTLSGLAPITDYVTVLESLTYENTASTPNTDSRDLSITVNDCTSTSPAQVVRVDVSATNDAPVINLDLSGVNEPNYVTTYTEGMPQVIVGAVTVTDTDSTHLSGLTAEISNPLSEDVLSVDPGTSTLVASYNAGILTISGYAPVADYEAVLASLTYDNLSDVPDATDRIVTIVANDGENSSMAVTSTVSIVAVNTAPSLNLDSLNSSGLAPNVAVSYITDAPAIPITHEVSITDPEETVLASALITLTGIVDGTDEVLSVDTSGTAITASSYTVDSGTGTLTLSGNESLDNYALVLESLRYINSAVTPTLAGDRIATISVNDGTSDSAAVTSTISLVEPDPLPDGVQCYSWQAGIAQGWIDVSANPLIVWDANGMYAQSPTNTETMQAQFSLPTSEPYSLVFSSNDALPYSLYNGETTGDVTTLISAQAGENYIVPGGVVELQWDVDPYTNLSETLVFEDFCFAPVANAAPIVDAGDDQIIVVQMTTIQLDASVSDTTSFASDLTYSWSILQGSASASLSDNTILNPVLTVDNGAVPQNYVLELSVSDGEHITVDTVQVFAVCEPLPQTPLNFSAQLDLSWTGGGVASHRQVNMTPIIVDLDLDGSSEILFLAGNHGYARGGIINQPWELHAIDGETGNLVISLGAIFRPFSNLATADIDGDGYPEFIAQLADGRRIQAYEHDGTLKWESLYTNYTLAKETSFVIANLEGDDSAPEIIFQGHVLDNMGNILWTMPGTSHSAHTITADLDLDGDLEIISGDLVYHHDGTVYSSWAGTMPTSFSAVANYDGDDYPEVVTYNRSISTIFIYDHNGQEIQQLNTSLSGGGVPLITNVDNDPEPEIGISSHNIYAVFDYDNPNPIWSIPIASSSGQLGATAFDFDGDGRAEIVTSDSNRVLILDGLSGDILNTNPSTGAVYSIFNIRSHTSSEMPVVADVDGDGHTEIVAVTGLGDLYGSGPSGIRVYEATNYDWLPTRPIWNQYNYHISNINNDASIPAMEDYSWLLHNTYRQNVHFGGCELPLPDIVTSNPSLNGDDITIDVTNMGTQAVTTDIVVSFYDGDPRADGVLVSTDLLNYDTANPFNINATTTGTITFPPNIVTTQTIWITAQTSTAIQELNYANNYSETDFEFKVDLSISDVDSTSLSIDPVTLDLSGTVSATIETIGTIDRPWSFDVVFFEDRDRDRQFDAQIDQLLSQETVVGFIANTQQVVTTSPQGTLGNITNPISVYVDINDSIDEYVESNNHNYSFSQCPVYQDENKAPSYPDGLWPVQLQAEWTTAINSSMPVVVVDLEQDGTPEILFVTYPVNYLSGGVLRAVRVNGNVIEEVWPNANTPTIGNLHGYSGMATGDVDGDGYVEIMVPNQNVDGLNRPINTNNRFRIVEHDGTSTLLSPPIPEASNKGNQFILADLNQDGTTDIIWGQHIYNVVHDIGNGTSSIQLMWIAPTIIRSVADLNLNGQPDLIGDSAIYTLENNAITELWSEPGLGIGEGFANFDDDPYPEILFRRANSSSQTGYIFIYDYDPIAQTWVRAWQASVSIGRLNFGSPAIANIDDDPYPEIGMASQSHIYAFDPNGINNSSDFHQNYDPNLYESSIWATPIYYEQYGTTGVIAFDFHGDGKAEFIHRENLDLRILDGLTGFTVWSTSSSSSTGTDSPVIADVDNDDRAELIMPSHNPSGGLQIYESGDDSWVAADPIWNQVGYHITNVNYDGTIPTYEANNWELHNNYRTALYTQGCANPFPDFIASEISRTETVSDEVTLTVKIGNQGGGTGSAGVNVSFYSGDPDNGGTWLATTQTVNALIPNSSETVSATIPVGIGTVYGPIWAVADQDVNGDGAYTELIETNNYASSTVYLMNPTNEAPVMTASADELAIDLAVDDTIALSGTITDTTLPIGQVEANWVVVSSPDAVTFSQQDTIFTTSGTNNVASDVTFTAGGEYVLALRGLDGEFTSTSDTLTITVTAPPEPPAPPQPNQTLDINGCIALPSHADSVRGLVDIVVDGNTSLTNTSVFYWSSNDPQAYVTLAEGLEVTANATVAVFDTTVLANDTYGVQLVGYDSTTLEEVVCGVGLYVTGEYKPGRVVLSTTDFTIPLAGLPITVGRTYDSLERNIQSDFGYGWSLALGDPRLEIDDSNNITLTLPNGQRKTFYWAPNPYPIGGFVAPNYQSEVGEYGSVSTNGCPLITGNICFGGSTNGNLYSQSVTTVTYEDPYGRKFIYGTDGRLQVIEDLNKNNLEFELDGIYSDTDQDPNTPPEQLVTFTRDAEGRITQITDNANQVYDYSYDANGDLVAVILPDTASTVDPTIGYSYYTEAEGLAHFFKSGTDPRGNPVIATTYDADGRLASVTDGVNNQTSYSYDVLGRTTTVTNPDSSTMIMGYDEWGNLTGETDELGRTTGYSYDPTSYNLLSVTNNDNETTSYSYDARGNRTSVTNGLGIEVISASYNPYGAPQTLRDANGVTRNIGYDAGTGMPLSASDPLGTIGSYTWNAQGSPTAVTDASGATTIYDYDDYGNVISQTAPATSDGSNIMLYGYDSMGRRISSKNFEGTFTETIYDSLGNVVSVTTYTDDQKTEILSAITYEYDANGNRTAVIDAANKRTEYLYDSNNRVVRVTAPNLTYSTTSYDWRGNVIEQANYSEGDMLQNSTCYGYDAAGQLTDVTQNCQIAGAPAGFVPVTTHYVYDNAGRRIETYEAWTGNPASSVLSSQVVYDDAGRVTSTTDAAGITTSYGYDPAGQLLTVTDALNRVTRYEYDVRGRRTRTIYPDGTFSVTQYDAVGRILRQTDALGYQMSYSYDAVGNLLSQTRASNTGIAQTTQYDYDVLGRRISMTDARGGVSQYVYDNLGRMSAMCDASVSTCTTGNYTATYSYNLLGQQTSVTDANGNMTSYSYDNMNRPEMIVYASGASIATTETIAYNARGQRISTTYAGYETAYSYDDMGRLSSTCQIVSGMCQQTTSYSYDLRGRQIATTNANGVTSRMVYDDASRLTMNIANFVPGSAQDPGTWSFNGTNWTDGSTTISHGVNADTNIISQYSYDALGRRASVRDVNGNVTSYTYESLTNRLAVMTHPDNTTVSYNYDALGRRTRMTDENGNATNYSYDPHGRLTAVQNPEGETVSYGYDANSNVTRITNGRNNSIRFVYDELNRLLGKCDAEGAYNCTDANPANHSYTTEYMYDANGNLVQEILADNTLNLFEYDALNRLSYEVYGSGTAGAESFGYSYDARGLLQTVYAVRPSVATANDILSSYSYDALARPTAVTHEDGQSIHYGYDDVGNRIGMRTEIDGALQTYVTYDHDALNRVTEVNDHDPALVTFDPNTWLTNTGATTTVFAYSTIGQMTTIARPNGVTTHYSYDPQRYFVDEIEHLDSTSTLGRYQYDYDNVGNRTGMDITAQDGSVTQIDYAYDDAYRLTSESYLLAGGATSTTSYQYDRAGNRTQMSFSSGTTTYSYNKDDELTRIDKPDFYFEDYTYDARGNLIQVEAGGHGTYSSTNYAYNAKDQMVSYGLGSTPFITYDYNHMGNRIGQTVSGTTTTYLWDEFSQYGDVILETNPTNTISYTLASGMLVAQTNNGTIDYFLQDAQNTTVGVVDSSGAVTSTYTYDAFGNLDDAIDPLSLETNYLYTGQQFDAIYTELYNLRARQYDPSIGRFTSRDTWAYNYQNPVELNRYAYSQNNPMTYSDPSGNQTLVQYTIGLGLVAAVAAVVLPNTAYLAQVANNTWDGFGSTLGNSINNIFETLQQGLQGFRTPGVTEGVGDTSGFQDTGVDLSGGIDTSLEGTSLLAEEGFTGLEGVQLEGSEITIEVGPSLEEVSILDLISFSVNTPAWENLTIDWEHINERHRATGTVAQQRQSTGNFDGYDLWPDHMSDSQVERTIRDAYANGSRIRTQDERILIQGSSDRLSTAEAIEIWVNTVTETIETAYPVFSRPNN